jgi:hypothetical protein
MLLNIFKRKLKSYEIVQCTSLEEVALLQLLYSDSTVLAKRVGMRVNAAEKVRLLEIIHLHKGMRLEQSDALLGEFNVVDNGVSALVLTRGAHPLQVTYTPDSITITSKGLNAYELAALSRDTLCYLYPSV